MAQPHLVAWSFILCSLASVAARAAGGAEPIVLNSDGGWCWFQDKRAVIADGKLMFASITHAGDVQVTAWELGVGTIARTTIRRRFKANDHSVPGLLVLTDGRVMAFYARHDKEPRMYWRVTTKPGDTREWEPERSYDAGLSDPFTYANPFRLPGEQDRIYNFWRGTDWNPTCAVSDDGGKTWSRGSNHIYFQKGSRPYVKYASNGSDTIHFAFTEDHPDNDDAMTSLYHAYYKDGGLYTSQGALVRRLADGPITPSEATRVYDGAAAATGRAWVWDIALDAAGLPVIAYSSHPDRDDLRYRYARWTGKKWKDRQIAYAGSCLYDPEVYYSGGICLDPDDTNTVYFSSNVDIRDGQSGGSGRYEIYQGVTGDGGATWRTSPITSGSSEDNLRPLVPAHHRGKKFVLWLRGRYKTYTDFRTEVVAYTDRELPPVKTRESFDDAPGTTRLVQQIVLLSIFAMVVVGCVFFAIVIKRRSKNPGSRRACR